jgi:8-oxo-dGTP pyrophosphatase MutT (NUDIX family)
MSDPTPNKINAVVGFLFDNARDQVVLIRKNKPDWMAGQWNGVGGKIEPGEDPYTAMRREFLEETGVDYPNFKFIFKMVVREWLLYYFAGFSTEAVLSTFSRTDERVDRFAIDCLPLKSLCSIRWQIPLALSILSGEIDWHMKLYT